MKNSKLSIYLLSVVSLLAAACTDKSDDNSEDFYIYGFLNTFTEERTSIHDNQSVYAEIVNHKNVSNLSAKLTVDSLTLIVDKYGYAKPEQCFRLELTDMDLMDSSDYTLNVSDNINTYSASTKILPYMQILKNDLEGEQLTIEWEDLEADFYAVEVWAYPENDNFVFITEETTFSFQPDQLLNEEREYFKVTISAFKGIDEIIDISGNISNCYGYFFSSSIMVLLYEFFDDLQPETSPKPDFDHVLNLFLKNENKIKGIQKLPDPEYIFSYAIIKTDDFFHSNRYYFDIKTYAEPVASIFEYSGAFNGHQLLIDDNYDPLIRRLYHSENIPNYFNPGDLFELNLNINGITESSTISIPDTFSILNNDWTFSIPTEPFEIEWRKPDNSKLYCVFTYWDNDYNQPFPVNSYITDQNTFIIDDFFPTAVHGTISVVAIDGINPLSSQQPNFDRHNCYFYSTRYAMSPMNFDISPLFTKNRLFNQFQNKLFMEELNKTLASGLVEDFFKPNMNSE